LISPGERSLQAQNKFSGTLNWIVGGLSADLLESFWWNKAPASCFMLVDKFPATEVTRCAQKTLF